MMQHSLSMVLSQASPTRSMPQIDMSARIGSAVRLARELGGLHLEHAAVNGEAAVSGKVGVGDEIATTSYRGRYLSVYQDGEYLSPKSSTVRFPLGEMGPTKRVSHL